MRLAKSPLAFRGRLIFMQALVVVAFGLLAAGYYRIQVLNHDHYQTLGEKFRVKQRPISATRGLIYDRHRTLVTRNLPAYDLVLMRDEMKQGWNQLRPRLAEFVGREEAELDAIYRKYRSQFLSLPIVLEKDIPFTQVIRVLRRRTDYPGVNVEVSTRRDYVYPKLFSHVLGYVGEATEAELSNRDALRMGDIVGKRGLERAYDGLLTGHDGARTVHVDSRGLFLRDEITKPPEPGQNLFLSLDLELQEVAARELGDQGGAVVLMDVRTGELLVFVSSPTFDLNLFTRRMSEVQWKELVGRPNQPLFNRPIQGLYAPGSVFKVVTALACLESGLIMPSTRLNCTGKLEYYGRTFQCHARGGHGELDLRGAIQKSCNLYFYQAADEVGATAIANMAKRLGLGRTTGIDLKGEKSGLVPSPLWKKEKFGRVWFPGETLSMAIGQGDLQVTPMQLLRLMAIVANDGVSPTPHFIHQTGRGEDLVPFKADFETVGLAKDFFAIVREGMWRVVNREHGTGSKASIPGRDVCGKTGTAQLVTFRSDADRKRTSLMNAWFAGFAPMRAPEVAIVVLIEHAGGGGVNAAPLARKVLEAYFEDDQRLNPI